MLIADVPPRPSSTDCVKMFASRHNYLSAPSTFEKTEWIWFDKPTPTSSRVGGSKVKKLDGDGIVCPCPRKVASSMCLRQSYEEARDTQSPTSELLDILYANFATPPIATGRATPQWMSRNGSGIVC
ncbi:hypothetical protein HK104_008828 [Borealophlyctis nickersoniae]|nr:hypothetical protein HK104_008828 [Borealophlyctis nickersoniae]